jgi:hypothetical protein
MPYRLLTEFENLFAGKIYRHRSSTQGDFVAMHLYEDLVDLNRSSKVVGRVQTRDCVISTRNLRQGIKARRGDGTFGEAVPGTPVITDPGYHVARGNVATVEIGAEMKILAKAMIKQIDRVSGDLQKQVPQFKRGAGNPICVALVGINHAPYAIGYEGDRATRTDGKANRHPVQEAADAAQRLMRDVAPLYDEFILLHYMATNDAPYPFSWVNLEKTEADYGAALVRISREYDRRF